jgi:4-amino-4-deoxy-L-arabinose transferase-like glycosyltransferase
MNSVSDRINSSTLAAMLKNHSAFLTIFLLSAFLFFVNLGDYQKFERAESYFSLGSKMLVETGEMLLPHSLQEYELNKPPMQYWVIGAAYKIFGVSYGAGRIPAALCALALIALTYFFGLKFFEKTVAVTAAGIAATVWMLISFARLAMPDLMLSLFISLALCCWILVLTDKTKRPRLVALAGYVFVALGFLTKGPVAVVLAFAPVFINFLITRNLSDLKKLMPITGAIVFLLVAAPYFLLVYLYHGTQPLYTFFIVENFRRFAGTQEYVPKNSKWDFPLTAFFGGFAPWSLLVFPAAFLDIKYGGENESRILRLLYLWMLFPVVFFFISSFKLDYYLLPIVPAFALIVARLVSTEYFSISRVKKLLIVFSVGLAIILLVGASFGMYSTASLFSEISPLLLPLILAAAILISLFFCLRNGKTNYILLASAFQIWLIFAFLCVVFIPAFSRFHPKWSLAEKIAPEAHVYLYKEAGGWVPNLAFQLPHAQTIKEFSYEGSPEELFQKDNQAVLLIYEKDFKTINNADLQILADETVYPTTSLSPKFISNPNTEKLLLVAPKK